MEGNSTKETNILLAIMLFFFSLWLFLKGIWGLEAYRKESLVVLSLTAPIGALLIISPYLKQKAPLLKIRALKPHWLFLLFLLSLIIIEVVYIVNNQQVIADESRLLEAIQLYIKNGRTYFFTHYTEIFWLGRQHPPLPVLCIAYLANLLGGNVLFIGRAIASILGLATAYCTFLIAKQLYNRRTAYVTVALLFGILHFFIFNMVSSNDIFVTFFFTLAVLLLLKLNTQNSKLARQNVLWAIAAGISVSLGMLSKYTMALVYLALPVLLLWPFTNRFPIATPLPGIRKSIRSGMPLFLITILFSAPLTAAWFWYLFQSGIIQEQINTVSYYVGTELEISSDAIQVTKNNYLNSWRINFIIHAILRDIPRAIGVYNLPLIGLGIWCWISPKKNGTSIWSNRFIAYWLAIIFIPILITLPVDRYFMPAYPALAILMANGLNTFYEQPLRIILLVILFSISSPIIYFFS
ncbi:MAG: glycosyltransferase family 39 protein [Lewinellaceae bacterium]|nr:glycosyltransferase family 39 protein [Lewinellaceae bacterium]